MAPEGYKQLRTDHVQVELPGIAYIELDGRDHLDWLQGQVTNDVRLLEERPWLDFCLTRPTGQIAAVCRAWRVGSMTLVATQQPQELLARVEEGVVLEDVKARRHMDQLVCVQGIETKRVNGALFSDRTGSGGVERTEPSFHSLTQLSDGGYNLATLEAGIPLPGIDYTDKTLPPELGPHFETMHVSYTKGCYVGQEVLMRIKARGHTNKTWAGLRASLPMQPGEEVTHKGKPVGSVARAAESPAFGSIASATLRNEATANGTEVQVGSQIATVVEMPFVRYEVE